MLNRVCSRNLDTITSKPSNKSATFSVSPNGSVLSSSLKEISALLDFSLQEWSGEPVPIHGAPSG
jgi:hypothetical protein